MHCLLQQLVQLLVACLLKAVFCMLWRARDPSSRSLRGRRSVSARADMHPWVAALHQHSLHVTDCALQSKSELMDIDMGSKHIQLGHCCCMLSLSALPGCDRSHADGELSKLIKRCPVSGAELVPGDDWGNIIYMTMCMDQGSGQGLQVRHCFPVPLRSCNCFSFSDARCCCESYHGSAPSDCLLTHSMPMCCAIVCSLKLGIV